MSKQGARGAASIRRQIQEATRVAYREAILEAAGRVFVRLGYHEAKMSDVAAETGVSVGTLYNYFESKEAVFHSLLERGRSQFFEAIANAQAAHRDRPLECLRAIVGAVLGFIEEHGELYAMYLQLGILSENDFQRIWGDDATQAYVSYLSLLAAVVERGQKRGDLRRDVDAATLGSSLAGILNAAVFSWIQAGRTDDLTGRAGGALAIFLEGAVDR